MPGRKKKSGGEVIAPGATEESRFTILLETIERQNRATIEAVWAAKNELREEFRERFDRMERRIEALEIAVRSNSEAIRKNSEDIAALQRDFARLARILGADRDENVIQALERRVKALEERVGI